MKKSIREWFESIENLTIRELALMNMFPTTEHLSTGSLSRALKVGFIWLSTPEGYNFWYHVYKQQFHQEGVMHHHENN